MIFRQILLFSGVVALIALQGCTSLKPQSDTLAETAVKPAEPPAAIPTRPFEKETLYELLLAEFAGKRNRADVALGKYLKQAHETRDPQVVERAAYIARYLGAHQATLDAAILWIDIDPENPTPRSLAATELIRFGKLDDAMLEIDALVNMNGDLNFEFLLQATRSSDMETRQRVLEKLREYTTQRDDAKLWFATGSLEAMNGRHEQAINDYDRALELSDNYSNAILARAQSMIALGESDAAMRYLEKQCKQHPRNKRLGISYARYLIQFGKLQDAQHQFEQLVQVFPEDGDLVLSLALLSWENKLEDDAVQYFNQLINMNYRTEEAYLYLARIAESRKQYDEAERNFNKVGNGPNFINARVQLALLYADQSRLDDAVKTLDSAAQVDSRNQLKYQLAKSEILANADHNQEAIAVLDQALAASPDETSLLYSRAMLKEKVGQFESMEKDLRRVLELQPNNSAALNALGYTFADRNQRLNEAWELIERAYQLNPKDPAIIDSMGWIKYRMGQPQIALDFLRQAYEAFRDQEIAAHLGEVLWITGNKEEAASVWRQSLQEHPESKVLQDVMKRFLPQH